jgi:F-type H+-transporting ATPase subunit delta
MKFTPLQYAQALFDAVSETAPKDHNKVLDNFVAVLKENGDLEKYGEIEAAFRQMKLKSEGVSEVEVTVAREAELNKGLVDEINRIVGNKAEIKKKVDGDLIGGVVVRVDDTLIDASVRTQLHNLNRSLKD